MQSGEQQTTAEFPLLAYKRGPMNIRRTIMAETAKPIVVFFVIVAILGLPTITIASQPQGGVTKETLTVPFTNGTAGVQTGNSYSDRVLVKVRGIGQASGAEWSDAFYIFTDVEGNPIEPYHPEGFTLWINGVPADVFVDPIPSYKPNHVHTFKMDAPGGPLTFGVGDWGIDDNTGGYEIVVWDLPH
jgi:hypothetical protein